MNVEREVDSTRVVKLFLDSINSSLNLNFDYRIRLISHKKLTRYDQQCGLDDNRGVIVVIGTIGLAVCCIVLLEKKQIALIEYYLIKGGSASCRKISSLII